MMHALQAIVFDFDGVIANSEPHHLRAFQEVLAERGLALSAEEYYRSYLGYDDVGMFRALAGDRGLTLSEIEIADLVARKGDRLRTLLQTGSVLFPGAEGFIRAAAAVVPIAIASGAMRHEIMEIVHASGLSQLFAAIVAAGDTPESKPSPAPYALAYERLREARGLDLDRRRCVAIEDSHWGIESAAGAGLRCIAVTSSYPADKLGQAELVVGGLHELTLEALDRLCEN